MANSTSAPPITSGNSSADNPYYESPQTPYGINSGVLLSAVLSLIFIALLIFLLHLYARFLATRRHRRSAFIIFRRGGGRVGGGGGGGDMFEEASRINAGVEPSVIATLPTYPYKKGIKLGQRRVDDVDAEAPPARECTVCLSELEEKDMVRLLPNCKHVFHVVCIDKWLQSNSTCPVCRAAVVPVKARDVPVDVGAFLFPLPPEPRYGGGSSASRAEGSTSSGTKEEGSTSQLGSSFRKMMNMEWLGRKVQREEAEDSERQ